jgi:hypothetical protein
MTTYYIYVLENPNNDEVFYVGITNNVENRRYCHQQEARKMKGRGVFPGMAAKDKYIAHHQIVPRLEVIDTIVCDSRRDAEKLEVYWMWQFRTWGFDLMNRQRIYPKMNLYSAVPSYITVQPYPR